MVKVLVIQCDIQLPDYFSILEVVCTFVTQCSIQSKSHIYRVGGMLNVLVIPCDIQLPACFSILKVEDTCLCFVRICTHSIRP